MLFKIEFLCQMIFLNSLVKCIRFIGARLYKNMCWQMVVQMIIIIKIKLILLNLEKYRKLNGLNCFQIISENIKDSYLRDSF